MDPGSFQDMTQPSSKAPPSSAWSKCFQLNQHKRRKATTIGGIVNALKSRTSITYHFFSQSTAKTADTCPFSWWIWKCSKDERTCTRKENMDFCGLVTATRKVMQKEEII